MEMPVVVFRVFLQFIFWKVGSKCRHPKETDIIPLDGCRQIFRRNLDTGTSDLDTWGVPCVVHAITLRSPNAAGVGIANKEDSVNAISAPVSPSLGEWGAAPPP